MIIVDASNLPRFMACSGSHFMPADPINMERDSTIREEGNAVHWLASTTHSPEEMIDRKAPNGIYITPEMAEHVTAYKSAIGDGAFEVNTSYSGTCWQINGRADHMSLRNGAQSLHVNDLKYGYTIVEPENNWTLISHAIGYCMTRGMTPQEIIMTVHQPRAPHYSGRVREWKISYTDLLDLYEQLSSALSAPSKILNTGPNCYRCHAFLSCPARQKAELNAIEVSETAFNAEISDLDLSFRLDQIARAKSLLDQSEKAYKEAALHRIKNGAVVPNYSAENELTNRQWVDGLTAEMFVAITGKDLAKRVLPTPRQAEQAGINPAVVEAFSERKNKGTKLIRINANKKATKLFGEKGK